MNDIAQENMKSGDRPVPESKLPRQLTNLWDIVLGTAIYAALVFFVGFSIFMMTGQQPTGDHNAGIGLFVVIFIPFLAAVYFSRYTRRKIIGETILFSALIFFPFSASFFISKGLLFLGVMIAPVLLAAWVIMVIKMMRS